MQHGRETVFLRKRKGFIRLAMQTGSHVVPCFAFGQTATYSWFRPGPPVVSDSAVQAFSRQIGTFADTSTGMTCTGRSCST
jgi:2-acylglycerol O-acyltransferase 2